MLRRGRSLTGGLALVGALLVLPAAPPALAGSGDSDGRNRGELTDEAGVEYGEVEFEVVKEGWLIKDFETLVLSVCTNPDAIGGIEVIEVPLAFDRVKVKRNGRFSESDTVFADPPSDSRQTYELAGRLGNARVRDGSVVLDGKCESNETFSAKRTG